MLNRVLNNPLFTGIVSCKNKIMRNSNHIIYYDYWMRDSTLEPRFKYHNEKYQADLKDIQDHMKRIAERTWKVDSHSNTTALVREFSFKNHSHATIFMNVVKDKCEELDHHPEWTLDTSSQHPLLKIRLTSHYLKNNLSPKDYELACFMNQSYEERTGYQFKYNQCTQMVISNGVSIGVFFVLFSIGVFFYQREKNYITRSSDFMFSKINH